MALSPFKAKVVKWSGYPDYQGVDALGNVWYAYGPPRR